MEYIDHLGTGKGVKPCQPISNSFGDNIVTISIPRTPQQSFLNLKIIHINNILMTYFPLPKDRRLLLLICVDHLDNVAFCFQSGSAQGMD